MATAAGNVMKRAKIRRRQSPNLVVVHGGKELDREAGKALLAGLSARLSASREQAEMLRPKVRLIGAPDRSSIRRLMDSVEAHLVSALWTLACLPNGSSVGRCGIPYFHTKEEIFANAVANGDWMRPKPGSPSPKAIDAMHRPLSWLEWLPRDYAAIVRAAADSKHGRPDVPVSWVRVRDRVVEARSMTIRTLQRRYETGLRTIAIELAFRKETL